VTSVSTEQELDAALAGRKTVALFHATWCPFCRAFVPVFRRAAPDARGYEPLEVVVDEDDNSLWDRYRIAIVPTVIFFEDGKVVRRLDGKPGVGLDEAGLRQALG
jgi:thiol-disulfide isomerase/thioredoxin